MDLTYALPVSALVIALATLVYSSLNRRDSASRAWVSQLSTASHEYVLQLEARVKECEDSRQRHEVLTAELSARIGVLETDKFRLMNELFDKRRPNPPESK